MTSLNRIHVPVLLKLLEECGRGGALDLSKKPTKKDIIRVLLARPTQIPVPTPIPMEVDGVDAMDDAAFVDDDGLPGKEIIDECKILEEKQKNAKKPVEPLTNREIDEIQAHLRTIKRPTWN
ncbi:hypothetical protein PAXINDRAFT_157828 [Paxillus involutus ATCC 200175]|uniref:Uncharacterized protein n=1 Tax=Paxillus involutus ATCC 200175 TaxID=664439 RepID=A0A0C9TFW1_PAXIN|nr:hypothetical protein PAXINDRAFT_157828 [Paxillus involutus ATCC 200175]